MRIICKLFIKTSNCPGNYPINLCISVSQDAGDAEEAPVPPQATIAAEPENQVNNMFQKSITDEKHLSLISDRQSQQFMAFCRARRNM